ncbi:MAG TPA: MmcQ/YjbR family DNA-binding protein [Paludibacteraceae bacterium]|jgi:predicted DNA-binding protein (MmcQ/YjbR family)|nr:MmcQ/YjbR family DNA-binding protein [Paludibacteraceae bacterium]
MDVERLREICLALPYVEEKFPFDDYTLVFYVGSKMFALTDLQTPNSVNLKCKPEQAIELRERYVGFVPGYHMNKKHWNTVTLNADVTDKLISELVNHSYRLVWNKLPRKEREALITG